MRTWTRMRGVIVAGLVSFVSGASVARAGEVWSGSWINRFEDAKAEWVFELPDGVTFRALIMPVRLP